MISKLVTMGRLAKLRSAEKILASECTQVASVRYLDSGVFIDLTGSEVILGHDVELCGGAKILTHTHEFSRKNWRELGEVENEKPTVIGDYSFIGLGAIITHTCKNIGKHAVIGIGAVVTKDVPDCEIWAGNPAAKIGEVDE